ncbi:hypothetical protein [Ekhidna sp.]
MQFLDFFKKHKTIPLILICISFLFLFLANINGVGFTYDSYDYFNAAKNLREFFFREEILGKIINRPPFYPVLIAPFTIFGEYGLTLLCLLIYSINSYLIFRLTRMLFADNEDMWISRVLILFSVTMHLVHAFLWTEGLIILLVLAQLNILFKMRRGSKEMIFLTLFGLISILTKNGMMLMVPVFASAGVVVSRVKSKWLWSLLYIIVCYGAFEVYRYYFGQSSIGEIAVRTNFFGWNYLNVISIWLMPMKVNTGLRLILTGAFILIACTTYIFRFKKYDTPIHGIVIIFSGYTLLRSYYSHIDFHESERYLSIVYPIFILMIIGLFNHLKKDFGKTGYYFYYVFIFYLLVYTILRAINNDIFWIAQRLFSNT